MARRDWIENSIIKSLEEVVPGLKCDEQNSEKIHQAILESMSHITELIKDDVFKNSPKILNEGRRDISKFRKRVYQIWKQPIDLLELFISFNLEYGVVVAESFRKKGDNVKFETLLRMHARSCQISSEILELLKGGFADGAMARWRTLYELSVISNYLVDKPNELIQRYLDYYFVENYFEVLEYQKNCVKLGYEALEQDEFREIERGIIELKKRYGEDFVKPYGG